MVKKLKNLLFLVIITSFVSVGITACGMQGALYLPQKNNSFISTKQGHFAHESPSRISKSRASFGSASSY